MEPRPEPRDSDGKFDPKASIAKVNRILDGCPDLRNCYRCGLPDLDECKCLCEGGCGKPKDECTCACEECGEAPTYGWSLCDGCDSGGAS